MKCAKCNIDDVLADDIPFLYLSDDGIKEYAICYNCYNSYLVYLQETLFEVMKLREERNANNITEQK